MQKNYSFDYIALVVGATIGAGFASGQEIVIFFARFGFVSVFFAACFAAIFCYCIILLLNVGARRGDFLKNNHILNSVLNIIFFMVSANMLSGANELLNELIYNSQIPVYSIFILIIFYLIIRKGLDLILKVNKIVVPIMIILTIFVAIFSFFVSTHSVVAINFDFTNLAMLTTSSILYTFCNILIICKILLNAGAKIKSNQIKKVAIISSVSLGGLIILIVLALLINDKSLLFSTMPMIYLAFLINKYLGYVYCVVILLSILTTLLSTVYSLTYESKKKSKILTHIVIFALSLFGFKNLIQYTYPIIGALGFVVIYNINSLKSANNFV